MNTSSRKAGGRVGNGNRPAAAVDARKRRSDGLEARERLLGEAMRLFAEKGYRQTSMREIAQAAGINVASISYYFNDKAGLYREVFQSLGAPDDDIQLFDQPHFSLRQSLQGFISRYLEPLKQSDLVRLCTMLHFREILEPTGMWAEEIESIKHAHLALLRVLCRHLDVAKPDDDMHRLAFSIAGLGLQIYAMHDVINVIRPKLIGSSAAVDTWGDRIIECAEAMVHAEAARRTGRFPGTKNPRKKKNET